MHVLRSHDKAPFSGLLRIFCVSESCLPGKDWSVVVNKTYNLLTCARPDFNGWFRIHGPTLEIHCLALAIGMADIATYIHTVLHAFLYVFEFIRWVRLLVTMLRHR